MTTQRYLDLAETKRLGDLFGIRRDLESAVDFAEHLEAAHATPGQDPALRDALSTACVVRYCRCFEGGVRAKLARDCVANLAPQFLEFHDYLFALRQKHLGHSVNEFEANHVAVTLSDDPADTGAVVDIAIVGGRVIGLDKPTAKHLKDLATQLLHAVADELESERAVVLELARSLPPDRLSALPEIRDFEPDWRRASETRTRHR